MLLIVGLFGHKKVAATSGMSTEDHVFSTLFEHMIPLTKSLPPAASVADEAAPSEPEPNISALSEHEADEPVPIDPAIDFYGTDICIHILVDTVRICLLTSKHRFFYVYRN